MTGRLVQGTDSIVPVEGPAAPAACRIVLAEDKIIGVRRAGAWWSSIRGCRCGRRYTGAGRSRSEAVEKADEWERRHLQVKPGEAG